MEPITTYTPFKNSASYYFLHIYEHMSPCAYVVMTKRYKRIQVSLSMHIITPFVGILNYKDVIGILVSKLRETIGESRRY